MNTLLTLLNKLESQIANSERLNLAVSKSSVGWHIAHTLLTTRQIIAALENSTPENYKWKFNLVRMYIYSINKIPRGQGKAPKSVLPEGVILADHLKKNIEVVKGKVNDLCTLNRNNYFEHPYFGKLNLKPAIRFLEIHTKHHIHIINDIVQANQRL